MDSCGRQFPAVLPPSGGRAFRCVSSASGRSRARTGSPLYAASPAGRAGGAAHLAAGVRPQQEHRGGGGPPVLGSGVGEGETRGCGKGGGERQAVGRRPESTRCGLGPSRAGSRRHCRHAANGVRPVSNAVAGHWRGRVAHSGGSKSWTAREALVGGVLMVSDHGEDWHGDCFIPVCRDCKRRPEMRKHPEEVPLQLSCQVPREPIGGAAACSRRLCEPLASATLAVSAFLLGSSYSRPCEPSRILPTDLLRSASTTPRASTGLKPLPGTRQRGPAAASDRARMARLPATTRVAHPVSAARGARSGRAGSATRRRGRFAPASRCRGRGR